MVRILLRMYFDQQRGKETASPQLVVMDETTKDKKERGETIPQSESPGEESIFSEHHYKQGISRFMSHEMPLFFSAPPPVTAPGE